MKKTFLATLAILIALFAVLCACDGGTSGQLTTTTTEMTTESTSQMTNETSDALPTDSTDESGLAGESSLESSDAPNVSDATPSDIAE